jgi:quercetin dioxygenase-like cupin family protein
MHTRIIRADDLKANNEPDATRFTGDAWLQEPPQVDTGLRAVFVHFTPASRTHWHGHATGQALYVLAGRGVIGTRGGSIEALRPGDIVLAPPGVEHWHGALRDSFMSHLSVTLEAANPWLKPVTDPEYDEATGRLRQPWSEEAD